MDFAVKTFLKIYLITNLLHRLFCAIILTVLKAGWTKLHQVVMLSDVSQSTVSQTTAFSYKSFLSFPGFHSSLIMRHTTCMSLSLTLYLKSFTEEGLGNALTHYQSFPQCQYSSFSGTKLPQCFSSDLAYANLNRANTSDSLKTEQGWCTNVSCWSSIHDNFQKKCMIVFRLLQDNELLYPKNLLMTFKFSLFLGHNRLESKSYDSFQHWYIFLSSPNSSLNEGSISEEPIGYRMKHPQFHTHKSGITISGVTVASI